MLQMYFKHIVSKFLNTCFMGSWTYTLKKYEWRITNSSDCQACPFLSNIILFQGKGMNYFFPEILAEKFTLNKISPSFALLQSILPHKSQSNCLNCMIFLNVILDILRDIKQYICYKAIQNQNFTNHLHIPVTLFTCLLPKIIFLMLCLSSSCLF